MGGLALTTLVEVCQGEIKSVTTRDHAAAANALLDRGLGKPPRSIDMIPLGEKLSELSTAELFELSACLSTGAVSDSEQPAEQAVH